MASRYPHHHDELQAFLAWRRSSEAQLPGIRGPRFETTCLFVPRSNLEKYFESPRRIATLLDALLEGNDRSAVDPKYVRDHYLQVFAVLCIGQGQMIHYFQQFRALRDQTLPYRTRPEDFPDTTPDIFDAFKQAQWQFCAQNLDYIMNNRFRDEEIIPFVHREKIGDGGSAVVYKIVVHEDYNKLRPQTHPIPDCRQMHKDTFVLKTYREAEAQQNYQAEREAYMNLRWDGKPSPHVLDYYGSFVHGNSYNIILEYADQGTLEDFMKLTAPPSTAEDNLLLWDRLFNVAHGIMTIHGNSDFESRTPRILNGWHKDVKPANILVLSGNTTSPYDRYFKIADLGLTHFKPSASHSSEPSDFEAFGTRAYGAPETFRFHSDSEASPLQVPQAIDIWSLAAVFSEVVVWARHSWSRVLEYRRQRSVEIEARGGGEGEHHFHHDGNLLDAVDNIHHDILIECPVSHHICRAVLDRLVNDMLQHGARPRAQVVFEKSKRLIKEFEKIYAVSAAEIGRSRASELIVSPASLGGAHPASRQPAHGPSEPSLDSEDGSTTERTQPTGNHLPPGDKISSTNHGNDEGRGTGSTGSPQTSGQDRSVLTDPQQFPSTAFNPRGTSEQQPIQRRQEEPVRPSLSIEAGHQWKTDKKNGLTYALPGEENLTALNARDHIFLIDSSEFMKQYHTEIERVVSLLAYILKGSDQDGLDIYFTQTLRNLNSRKSSKLSRSIFETSFRGTTDMRASLARVLKQYTDNFSDPVPQTRTHFGRQLPSKRQRPLSVYILTDGKWQPTDVGGYIKSVVQKLIDANRPKEFVAIQFIRFGNDQGSIDKLNVLDCGLGLKARGMDIVDHTYWNDNVWKHLLGALNDWYDDDPL